MDNENADVTLTYILKFLSQVKTLTYLHQKNVRKDSGANQNDMLGPLTNYKWGEIDFFFLT